MVKVSIKSEKLTPFSGICLFILPIFISFSDKLYVLSCPSYFFSVTKEAFQQTKQAKPLANLHILYTFAGE